MKTPIYETSPGALAALLNGGQFIQCQLHTVVLSGGLGTLRFTDADVDIKVNGVTWSSKGIRVDTDSSRATGHWKRGLDLDNWLVVLAPRLTDQFTGEIAPDKIGTVPWAQAARGGALYGADWQVDRAYLAAWPQPYQAVASPVGVLTIFAGQPAEVDVGDLIVAVTLEDYRALLTTSIPINVYQAGCRHTLFDLGCGLLASTFAVAGVCLGGSTRAVIKSSVAAPAGSGTYTLGRIVMLSGLNSGFSRFVTSWTPGSFSLLHPLPFDIVAGDTFSAYPGCNKDIPSCTAFANLVNYGGDPFIPAPETAL
jgi:uncharacterized phage protein (TIGR02218 family)